jgi:hypothetical protein
MKRSTNRCTAIPAHFVHGDGCKTRAVSRKAYLNLLTNCQDGGIAPFVGKIKWGQLVEAYLTLVRHLTMRPVIASLKHRFDIS